MRPQQIELADKVAEYDCAVAGHLLAASELGDHDGRGHGWSAATARPASQLFLFDFPGHCWLLEFVVCVAPTSNINLKIRAPQAMPTTTTTTILRMRMRSLVIWLLSFVVLPRPGHA